MLTLIHCPCKKPKNKVLTEFIVCPSLNTLTITTNLKP